MDVGIIGGGNSGTAIANFAGRNGHRTHLWLLDEAQMTSTRSTRVDARYPPGHPVGALGGPNLAKAVARRQSAEFIVPSTWGGDAAAESS